MTTVTRKTILINNTTVTGTFYKQMLSPDEGFEVPNSELALFRDDATVSGAVESGDLVVSDGEKSFDAGSADAVQWFFDNPRPLRPTTLTVTPDTLVTLSSGVDDVGGIDYVVGTHALQGTGKVVVTSGEEAVEIFGEPDEPDVDAINAVTGTVTVIGSDGNVVSTVGSTLDVAGFHQEFVAVSGEQQAQINLNSLTNAGGFLAQDETQTDTTSHEWIEKLTLDVDLGVIATGTTDQLRMWWYYEWGYSGANSEFESQMQIDDMELLSEHKWRPTATQLDSFVPSGGYVDVTVVSGTHFFDLDFRASPIANKTARIRRCRMSIARLRLVEGVEAPALVGELYGYTP